MSSVTRFCLGLALGLATLASEHTARATSYQTLHSFTFGADGASPLAGLLLKSGLLYGTTAHGGAAGDHGTVFKLDPVSQVLTTLHSFTGGGADGGTPYAGLVSKGSVLYGTTFSGGAANNGTVFKLDSVTQALTILHSFSGADGAFPRAGLVFGPKGMLYGTTSGGGPTAGTVFKLDPVTKILTTLHTFTGGADGGSPQAVLVFDKTGTLYGTTASGGGPGYGTAFKLDPVTQTLTTLYSFGGASGAFPHAGLTIHYLADGTFVLYGTTILSAGSAPGTAFKLDPVTKILTTLHAFTGGADGASPAAGLVFKGGALYGTTQTGGMSGCYVSGCGTVFKLDPKTDTLTTLYSFGPVATDGIIPEAGVVFDKTGALYGTTSGGATGGVGTVFKLTTP